MPILKYSGFIRSRGYCKCDQDILLNVQDGTCDHGMRNLKGGTGDHGMLKLVGGTCVESHLQYGGSPMRPCEGIHSFCLVDVSLSFGYACVCEWLDVSISCTSLFMGCCCNVNNFMCSVRWLGDPLFMGNGAIAKLVLACTCLFLFLRGSDPPIPKPGGVPLACAVACPDSTEFKHTCLSEWPVLRDGFFEWVVLREDRSLWFTWS